MTSTTVASPPIVEAPAIDELLAALRRRDRSSDRLRAQVRRILERVRRAGDAAVHELTLRHDGVASAGEIPPNRWRQACEVIPPEAARALRRSCAALRRWHEACRPLPVRCRPRPGVLLERRPVPLRRVGVYAPGGRFAYASSVLMGVVPARAAGVEEVVVVSPPGTDGRPAPAVAAACAIAGADRLFAVGGAQAVAALAYGTETIPRVDKIVGPGNVWVQEAKQQVAGRVAVDLQAGPTEIAILADAGADPRRLTLELLAQAEHDPEALALLVGWNRRLLERVAACLRAERARAVGGPWLVRTRDLDEAIALLDALAPEHLLVAVTEPERVLPRLRTAGTVIVGGSVVLSDYATGANHVLPTGGSGRFASGLGTDDFCRWMTVQSLQDAGPDVACDAAALARLEGLARHEAAARSARPLPPHPDRSPLPPPAVPEVRRRQQGPDLRLDDNRNLWGPPAAALSLLRRTARTDLLAYPSRRGEPIRQAVARRWGVSPRQVTAGCGSDDLLAAAFRAFAGPGRVVALPRPTFQAAAEFAAAAGAHVVRVDWRPGESLPVAGLAAAGPDVIYLARPDNPTGAWVPVEQIRVLAPAARRLLIVDEAYVEFAGSHTLLRWAATTRGVLVVRTLSKAWGLAGLRVGYCVGAEALIEALDRHLGPYRTNVLAERVGAAVLGRDDWLEAVRSRVRAARGHLRRALLRRGFACLPSRANFLFARPPLQPARRWRDDLLTAGVAVRLIDDLPDQEQALRITVAPEAIAARLLARIDRLRREYRP